MNRLARLFVRLLLCLLPVSAHAQDAAQSVSRGLAWLAAQVQADGRVTNESASVATVVQVRSESALALRLLASLPGALADVIGADTDTSTEHLARRAVALLADGRDASPLISALTARQNGDGGLGNALLFQSTVLDTAWAVLAWNQAGLSAGDEARRARGFLLANVMADGGLRGQDDQNRLYNNALGLLALQTTADGSTASAIQSIKSWLMQRQEADGGWGVDAVLSAYVLLAIAPGTADATVLDLARSHLIGLQAADGSWGLDPFVTALAVRALLAKPVEGGGGGAAAVATIEGLLVDQNTNVPLPGVQVDLTGPVTAQVSTDVTGRFRAGGLGAGTYTVQFIKSAYATRTGSVTVGTGQAVDLGLIQLPQLTTVGVVRGQVTDATSNAPLAGVNIALSGAATAATTTAADGSFQFLDVAPGSLTLTATLTGYQSASGAATLAGGQTLLFSPKLYRTTDTPPTTGSVFGTVVSASTGTPLAGVALVANGTSAGQTGADGKFNLSLAPNTYEIVYSLTGYDAARQSFVLPAGTNTDAGTIALLAQHTTTTIRGVVRNDQAAPIAGATVQIANGATATAAADGTYLLADLAGTAFDLRISATGFNSVSARLQIDRPAEVVQDFVLAAQTSGQLAIGVLSVTSSSAPANTDVSAATTISNTGGAAASVVAVLQVFNSAGEFAGKGAAYDTSGALLSTITLAAGEQRSITLRWNTARFAPGEYTLRAQLVEPGSINAANPNGNILLERAGRAVVTAEARFIGTVTANPPVLRAGLNQSIELTATIQNDGNVTLDAQQYTLRAINTQTNAVVATRTAQGEAMAVSGIQTLLFPNWTPEAGGDFRLEVTSPVSAQGLATGKAYVGDAARATYTVDKLFVPAGTQTVKGTLTVEGQDVTTGTISDPLAPLIKAAVQKAVAYTDREGAAWTSRGACIGCHIQTHALFGGETNRRFVPNFDVAQRNSLYNILASRLRGDGSFYNPEHFSFRDTISRLSAWALSAWRDKKETAPNDVRAANYLMTRQLADGRWNPDYTSTATGEGAIDHTPFILESLIRLEGDVPALQTSGIGIGRVTRYLSAFSENGNGALARDSSGNLYFGVTGGTRIVQIRPDGTIGDQWSGLNSLWSGQNVSFSMVEALDGNGMWLGTMGGIVRLAPGGTWAVVNSSAVLTSFAKAADGSLWAVAPFQNAIYRVSASGAPTLWLQSSQFNLPLGLAFDSNGDILMVSHNNRAVFRVRSDKSISTQIPSTFFTSGPLRIVRHAGRWFVSMLEAVYAFNDEWRLERVVDGSGSVADMVSLPDGSLLGAYDGVAGIRRLSFDAVDFADLRSRLDTSIDRAATWLTNLNLGSTTDNRQLAHHLLGLGEAAKFYKGTARETTIRAKMQTIGELLKSRQRADGGWGRFTTSGSDSYITATIGFALDYLDPSPSEPYIRKAVTWLLSRQQADGSWISENGIFSTRLGATNWVSIWLPVMLDRLGGIDTDLAVTFPSNVVMSAPTLAPTSTTPGSDGSVTYKWSMVGVTSEGRSVSFDLSLPNLAVGEARPVSTEAKLTFKNSFTNAQQDAPIVIPKVTASAFLELGVATDKATYPANTAVLVSAQVTHTGANLASGNVQFEIYAPDNVLVSDLGRVPFSGVAANAAASVQTLWNTAAYAAAPGYYVKASLFDATNAFVATAKAVFAIEAAPAGSPTVSGAITTDKTVYAPTDSVIVTDRIRNLTANLVLDGLSAVTTVSSPSGNVVFTRTEPLAQLLAGSTRDLPYRVTLRAAQAGQYTATLSVTSAQGAPMAAATTTFAVQSTAQTGLGLTGTISASPKEVEEGAQASFAFSLTNSGNAAVSGLPLTIRVLDPAKAQVLAELPAYADAAVGATFSSAAPWTVTAPPLSNLTVGLYAHVSGTERLLAQDSFKVIESFKVTVGGDVVRPGRVLVLVSCPVNGDGTGADRPECVAERIALIRATLDGLGLTHLVTSDLTVFATELRTGRYNLLWITGGAEKLDHVLAGEVRDAVQRGDSLLLDGIHDERNRRLDGIVGIKYLGKYNDEGLPINVGSDRLPMAALATRGRSLRLQLDATGGADPQVDAVYSAYPARPAIITSPFGLGRAVLFTFDWVGTLRDVGLAWKPTAQAAFGWIAPQPTARVAEGALTALRFAVTNTGRTSEVIATAALPAGFTLIESQPTATFEEATRTLAWRFTLAAGQTTELTVWLRAPNTAGQYSLPLTVKSATSATAPAISGNAVVEVVDLAALGAEALAAIQALAPTNSAEVNARDRALAEVQSALVQTAGGQPIAAIASLVDAGAELRRIETANPQQALTATARVLAVVERRASPN